MTKFEKSIGVTKKKLRPIPSDKPTPKRKETKTHNKFGYKRSFTWGRYSSSYTSWFATAKQRDQALAAAKKNQRVFSNEISYEKVER